MYMYFSNAITPSPQVYYSLDRNTFIFLALHKFHIESIYYMYCKHVPAWLFQSQLVHGFCTSVLITCLMEHPRHTTRTPSQTRSTSTDRVNWMERKLHWRHPQVCIFFGPIVILHFLNSLRIYNWLLVHIY